MPTKLRCAAPILLAAGAFAALALILPAAVDALVSATIFGF